MFRKSTTVPVVVAAMVMSLLGLVGAAPGAAAPPAGIGVETIDDPVEVWGFSGPVTVAIYDQPGGTYLGGGTAANGADDVLGPEAHGVDIKGGMEVVADDGATEKRLVVRDVRVKVLNVKADFASGTAHTSASSINVYASTSGGDCQFSTAVTNGKWKADFSVAPCVLDLDYVSGIEAWTSDADGDNSIGRWFLPRCNGKDATVFGTPGADKLGGTAGPDVIHGFGGNDTINGFGGNDVICGGAGVDAINGGKGKDKVFGQAGKDTISGGLGADVIEGGTGADTLHGNGGTDTIRGGAQGDTITGGPLGDALYGNAGADTIESNGGPDTIRGGLGADTCDGGAGVNDVSGC